MDALTRKPPVDPLLARVIMGHRVLTNATYLAKSPCTGLDHRKGHFSPLIVSLRQIDLES